MTFKIAINPTYMAPVNVAVPGSTSKSTFDAEFKRLSQTEIDELRKQLANEEITDAHVVRQVLAGWKGLVDDNGAVEFSETALDTILEIYPLPYCIARAFFDSLGNAKQKN